MIRAREEKCVITLSLSFVSSLYRAPSRHTCHTRTLRCLGPLQRLTALSAQPKTQTDATICGSPRHAGSRPIPGGSSREAKLMRRLPGAPTWRRGGERHGGSGYRASSALRISRRNAMQSVKDS